MARRANKSLSIGWLVVLLLFALSAAATVTYFARQDGKVNAAPTRETAVVLEKQPIEKHVPEPTELIIFVPVMDENQQFYLKPVTKTTEAKGDVLDLAMEALIEAIKHGGEQGNLIPEETELLAPVKVKDNVATVNLSEEFVNDFSGGSVEEALTLNAIAQTLVHNGGGKVARVQILVEGAVTETLGGHFDISTPYSVDSVQLKSDI